MEQAGSPSCLAFRRVRATLAETRATRTLPFVPPQSTIPLRILAAGPSRCTPDTPKPWDQEQYFDRDPRQAPHPALAPAARQPLSGAAPASPVHAVVGEYSRARLDRRPVTKWAG
jgi:hypothetical protein